MITDGERTFIEQYGHRSTCNCIRVWKGRYLVTRRKCDCDRGVPNKPFKDWHKGQARELTEQERERMRASARELGIINEPEEHK